MERRDFAGLLLSVATGGMLTPVIANSKVSNQFLVDSPLEDKGMPAALPDNIKQLIKNVLKLEYKNVNTDWDGTIQVEGLLRFAKRGYKDGLDYASNWFNYHVENDGKMTDEEYYKQYDGPHARILRDGPLTFVLYSANLGVSFPVHELYNINKSKIARQVCIDVADAILHYAGRDRFGMLAHDDYNYINFAIPDTAYWATRANAIAASLSKPDVAEVYWKQSIYQLSQGIKYFFDSDKNLVRTGLFKGEKGTTYWCRSQGWLIWAISGLLRYLPQSHPYFKEAAATMKLIADSAVKYQTKSGAFHVLVNDPSSPEEVTGMAMVLASVKEGMRKGWLPKNYDGFCNKGWEYIKQSVDAQGILHNVYTGWAVPAEEKKVNLMDQNFRGFAVGIIIVAADEMTR
ncbi:glycoside hydrolase family 88 protein [Parasediminibacterium sp. JCM 36343]|uniref:glycoside hydrolase family 88 protein n=1 Tax=Parasediminibacterium sp. JCM 36343 TaxID=3374279 RepID=UPI00397B02F5